MNDDLKEDLDEASHMIVRLIEVVRELTKIDIYLVDKIYGDSAEPEAVAVKLRVWNVANDLGLCDQALRKAAESMARKEQKDLS